ncbi:MAG: FliA/WhiG family RNA polymerase sigma factor [Planctomycetota bacterium]
MSYAEDAYARGSITDKERNTLVEEYLPLVRHVIGRLPLSLPAFMDQDDLFEVGVLGLMNAAKSFNPNKGAQFKTHAYVNIRGAILDELRRHDVLPRSRRDRIKQVKQAADELEEELGRCATPEEIADAMGLSIEQVESVLVNMHGAAILSLDQGESNSEGQENSSLAACLSCMNTPTPADLSERNELKAQLQVAIAALPKNERHMIVLYYKEGMLLKEIGAILGVTESRVSQLHSRAVFRLNQALSYENKQEI